MVARVSAEVVAESTRRAIFKALVEAQDAGQSVPASRAAVAIKYSVTDAQLRAIEDEGADREWPPL